MPESIRNDLKFTLGVKRAYTHGKFLARNHLGDQFSGGRSQAPTHHGMASGTGEVVYLFRFTDIRKSVR